MGAGDVNGDGYADLAFGDQQTVSMFWGRAAGLSAPPQDTWGVTSSNGLNQGVWPGFIGDTNADGLADLAVCNGGDDTTYVHNGATSGFIQTPVLTLNGVSGVPF
jgi:hypothetical protein